MYLQGRSLNLRKSGPRSRLGRVFVLSAIIISGVVLISFQEQGKVQPLFIPTPTATREPTTYASEAEAHFAAGKLLEAITQYEKATAADPKNLEYWVALARVQVFAGRYEAALKSAETALMLDANNAKAKAVYAWTLDWNVYEGCRCRTLAEAEAAALQAVALDSNYALAHAYYSEILNDSQKWAQGFQEAETALALDPNLLEAHRAMGYAYESTGNYEEAIASYRNALNINPKLVTLWLRLGLNYRALYQQTGAEEYVDQAIQAFGQANAIDPENIDPYLYLSRTHYQNDELGTAIQYLEQALKLAPDNPDIHGRLGLILFKKRNYEGAEPELRLAILGGRVDGLGNPLTDANGNPLLDANGDPVVSADGKVLEVKPLALSGSITLEYYYTYGNLLAFLRRCSATEAPFILQKALNFAPDDPTVKASYEESMAVCNGIPLPTDEPEETATETPTP